MFGHIIVDGPDAVGKTTLAKYINDKYSFKVVHNGADRKNDYDYYHELITSNNHDFYDRFMAGEFVNPKIYNREPKLRWTDIDYICDEHTCGRLIVNLIESAGISRENYLIEVEVVFVEVGIILRSSLVSFLVEKREGCGIVSYGHSRTDNIVLNNSYGCCYGFCRVIICNVHIEAVVFTCGTCGRCKSKARHHRHYAEKQCENSL